jgi:hypothetical protein
MWEWTSVSSVSPVPRIKTRDISKALSHHRLMHLVNKDVKFVLWALWPLYIISQMLAS